MGLSLRGKGVHFYRFKKTRKTPSSEWLPLVPTSLTYIPSLSYETAEHHQASTYRTGLYGRGQIVVVPDRRAIAISRRFLHQPEPRPAERAVFAAPEARLETAVPDAASPSPWSGSSENVWSGMGMAKQMLVSLAARSREQACCSLGASTASEWRERLGAILCEWWWLQRLVSSGISMALVHNVFVAVQSPVVLMLFDSKAKWLSLL